MEFYGLLCNRTDWTPKMALKHSEIIQICTASPLLSNTPSYTHSVAKDSTVYTEVLENEESTLKHLISMIQVIICQYIFNFKHLGTT